VQTAKEQFEAAVAVAKPLIDAELALAAKHLARAKEISEKHGVPFSSRVTDQVRDTYTPSTFYDKFKGLNGEFQDDEMSEFMDELLGIYIDTVDSYGSGWEKSYC
jgi:hypothetical protein